MKSGRSVYARSSRRRAPPAPAAAAARAELRLALHLLLLCRQQRRHACQVGKMRICGHHQAGFLQRRQQLRGAQHGCCVCGGGVGGAVKGRASLSAHQKPSPRASPPTSPPRAIMLSSASTSSSLSAVKQATSERHPPLRPCILCKEGPAPPQPRGGTRPPPPSRGLQPCCSTQRPRSPSSLASEFARARYFSASRSMLAPGSAAGGCSAAKDSATSACRCA